MDRFDTIPETALAWHREGKGAALATVVLVIASGTMLKCIDTYLACNLYRIGDKFISQDSGVPIGGYLSSGLLNAHLACGEDHITRHGWKQKHIERPGILR